MFLFKTKNKQKNTNINVNTESYNDEEFEKVSKSPKQTLIHMSCCDAKINIDKLYDICLCPNCNTHLDFIIEKNNVSSNEEIQSEEIQSEEIQSENIQSEDIQSENKYTKIIEEIQTKIQNTSQKDIEIFAIVVVVGIISYFMYTPMCTQSYL